MLPALPSEVYLKEEDNLCHVIRISTEGSARGGTGTKGSARGGTGTTGSARGGTGTKGSARGGTGTKGFHVCMKKQSRRVL